MRTAIAMVAGILSILCSGASLAKDKPPMICRFDDASGGTLTLEFVLDPARPAEAWMATRDGAVVMFEVRPGIEGLTLFRFPPIGPAHMITISHTGRAVQSLHSIREGVVSQSQYPGKCR